MEVFSTFDNVDSHFPAVVADHLGQKDREIDDDGARRARLLVARARQRAKAGDEDRSFSSRAIAASGLEAHLTEFSVVGHGPIAAVEPACVAVAGGIELAVPEQRCIATRIGAYFEIAAVEQTRFVVALGVEPAVTVAQNVTA